MRALAILLLCFACGGAARGDGQAKGWLGAAVEDLPAEEAAKTHGVKVAEVTAGGPAAKAGIETGDIILSLDRVEVEDKAGFEADLAAKAPGTEIKLSVRRGASEKRLAVTLGAQPVEQVRAEPKDVPILQLDSGGHMANINGVAFTPDGKFVVSAGDDKVIRIWDWRAGKTVRTIRGQSGPGQEGKIYAMALSPDGKWLAAGGWFAPGHGLKDDEVGTIRLYDFKSGELKALLKGHTNVVHGLAFSPNGKKLISGSGDETAIIWDIESGQLLQRLSGHGGNVTAVAFNRDGSRIATASDRTIRLWNEGGGLLVNLQGHTDRVQSVAFSPADDIIASTGFDETLKLWNFQGQLLRSQDTKCVWHLSFDPSGKFIVCDKGGLYEASSGKLLIEHKLDSGNSRAAAFSPDSDWAVSGDSLRHRTYVWDAKTGRDESILHGSARTTWALGFSADGCWLAWGNRMRRSAWDSDDVNDYGDLEFEIGLPCDRKSIGDPRRFLGPSTKYIKPITKIGKVSLKLESQYTDSESKDNRNLLKVMAGTDVVAILDADKHGFRHQAYTFTPDGSTVLSGGANGSFTAYSAATAEAREFTGHVGYVWAVAVTPDGRLAASGADDGTINLWNLKTRELIVSFYYGTDGEWVMWTPQGYYAGSPGAGEIVGWQINRGPDKAADYATAGQLRQRLHRPDIVAKAIALASAEEAVRTSHGTEFKLSDLLGHPAPQLRILSPAPGSTVKTPGVKVKIALGETADPVEQIRIQVNSRNIGDWFGYGPGEHPLDIPLVDKGKNTIVITAKNKTGWSKLQEGTLTLINEAPGEPVKKRGTLYILAAGVSKYPGVQGRCKPAPDCDLGFTGKDASAFADIMEQRLGAFHKRVVRRVLVNDGKSDGLPNRVNIEDELGSLWNNATDDDTVAIFLSGHGVNEGGNYYFLPTDAASANGSFRSSSVVSWRIVAEKLDATRGRRLVFLDSCHAAGGYNELLGDEATYANILAYSAAKSDQRSWESWKYGHGIFTQAILDGLAGAADLNHDGHVDTEELDAYLKKRVPELAAQLEQKPQQDPQFFKARDAESYTLAAFK